MMTIYETMRLSPIPKQIKLHAIIPLLLNIVLLLILPWQTPWFDNAVNKQTIDQLLIITILIATIMHCLCFLSYLQNKVIIVIKRKHK